MLLQPVALPAVAPELLAKAKPPACALKAAEAYPPGDLEVERRCLAQAEAAARARHEALAAAVRVREAKMAEVVKSGAASGARAP